MKFLKFIGRKGEVFVSRRIAEIRASARMLALLGSFVLASMSVAHVWSADAAININTDSPEVMAEGLSGVGIAKAYRIVEHREAYGPFESIEELSEVKGIGTATVERNRERLVLD